MALLEDLVQVHSLFFPNAGQQVFTAPVKLKRSLRAELRELAAAHEELQRAMHARSVAVDVRVAELSADLRVAASGLAQAQALCEERGAELREARERMQQLDDRVGGVVEGGRVGARSQSLSMSASESLRQGPNAAVVACVLTAVHTCCNAQTADARTQGGIGCACLRCRAHRGGASGSAGCCRDAAGGV